MPGVLGMPSLGRTEDSPVYGFWRLSVDHQRPSWAGETQFLMVSAKSFMKLLPRPLLLGVSES